VEPDQAEAQVWIPRPDEDARRSGHASPSSPDRPLAAERLTGLLLT